MQQKNENQTHEVFVEVCGMTAAVFRGLKSVCDTIASQAPGKPFKDTAGNQIGVIERAWVKEVS